MSPGHWGRGIAGAMVGQALIVVPELFEGGHLQARVSRDNPATAQVLTRRGFYRASDDSDLDQYACGSTETWR